LKVLVLTTSYSRDPDDPAGRFFSDAAEAAPSRGMEVEVASPSSFHQEADAEALRPVYVEAGH